MNAHRRRLRRTLALTALVPLLSMLVLTGCSGGSSNGSSSASAVSDSGGASGADSGVRTSQSGTTLAAVRQRSVVSTGSVSLGTRDVGALRARVERLLRTYDGFLADEQTSTDERGRASRSTLTVRVPSKDFDAVLGRLAGLGTLRDSTRKAEDVTTRVVDVKARIGAEEIGLRRLEQLLARSGSLADLLAVEKQVTERRASLESLKQQQAYLADQTSLATIKLTIDRSLPAPAARGHGGFVGGLQHGWAALVVIGSGLLRATGAALPFLALGAVLWLPVRALVRRLRRPAHAPVEPVS